MPGSPCCWGVRHNEGGFALGVARFTVHTAHWGRGVGLGGGGGGGVGEGGIGRRRGGGVVVVQLGSLVCDCT